MANKPGYKHTELGLIPNDWEVIKLKDCFKLSSGKTKPIEISDSLNGVFQYPIYGGNGILGYSKEFNTSDKRILIGRVGEYCGITRQVEGSYWITDNALYTSEIRKDISIEYLTYKLQKIDLSKQRNKGGQPLISQQPIYILSINLPPLPEQKKIAEILSTWDKAIEKTEQLIEAKKKIKKGLMQKLLTGKLRFKEFKNENWEKKKLSSFLIQTSYPVPKPTTPYTSLGIKSHGKGTLIRYVDDPTNVQMDTLYEVKRDELIVNITFGWEGAITIVKPEDEGNLVSHRFPTFKFNTKVAIPDYFKHVIKTNLLVFHLGLISPGGAGRNRVLNKQDLIKLVWTLPSIKEQIKISSLLNSFDKDIDLLIKNLQSLKEQKKGLMQKLLTGEVRVKV